MAVKGSGSDRQELEFHPGPHAFLLGSSTIGEDADFKPGHRLIFTFDYQTLGGFQVPEHVVVKRESHREIWRYQLTGCKLTTNQ